MSETYHEEEALGRAYDARLMRRLLRYVRPYTRLVLAALLLLLCEGALQLVGPFLTRRVIDVAVPAGDTAFVARAAGFFALALIAQFACAYGEALLTGLLGQRVMHDLRQEVFAHLQRLSVGFFDRNPAGRLLTRVTGDVETLNELFTSGVVSGLGDVFTLTIIAAAMLIADWRLALAAFVVIPGIVLVSQLFRRSVRESYREVRTRLARMNSLLQERIAGVRVIQLFNREQEEIAGFGVVNRAHLQANLRGITAYALYFPAIEVLTSVALASLLVVGARYAGMGALTVGTVAAFLQLVRRFFEPIQDLSEKYNILQTAMASSERVFKLLDTTPTVPDTGHVRVGQTGPVEIRFENVWFAYDVPHVDATGSEPAEREWILRGVSFVASPGRTLAIVGHTGAGKTTIVNLLMRFYDPQRGRILLNGHDLRDLPLDDTRALIGYVQQEIFLFAGDVRSNIRLANDVPDQAVEAAARQVGAHAVVSRLPGGYGYELGERGTSLSFGERQLLSFARAVAANPPVLLLDEATSAVDSRIEAELQQALGLLRSGRTTIAVAHRLSTIADADEILVLHHGAVAERGTHRDLVDAAGLYGRLWRLQTGGDFASAFGTKASLQPLPTGP
jgi:ATP-binding cassette subfamily B multidrug efflux pump